jgi:hypothetical protein
VPFGCDATAVPVRDAIGVYDPTKATSPSALETVIGDLAKPNNYIGANSSPDVANANLGNPTAAELNAFVGQIGSVATNVYGTRAAPVNNPSINFGTAANPAIDVVYGNYSMGPTTGYGILVVTGTLTFSGNYSWNGLILVIGDGASVINGGSNGQIFGAFTSPIPPAIRSARPSRTGTAVAATAFSTITAGPTTCSARFLL